MIFRRHANTAFLAVALLLLAPTISVGASMTFTDAQGNFQKANQLYQQQQFNAARDLYRSIADAGVQSPEVFYNLGTVSGRLGERGEAVLYLERAARLLPRNPDVQENLSRVRPQGFEDEPFILAVPFHWVSNRFTVTEWTGAFLILFGLLGVCGALLLARRLSPALHRVMRSVTVLLSVFTLCVGGFAGWRLYQHYNVLSVVVMEADTLLRSGPGENFAQLLSVPEGARIRRLPFTDTKWSHVELPGGRRGYMPTAALQSI